MSQSSKADYLTLKNTLLKMWIPVVGARTAAEFWAKNCEKLLGDMLKVDNVPCVMKDWIEKLYDECLKLFVFEADNYFDNHPPFEISEILLTGSFSEGLLLYSRCPPDMDFMCVLKDISFSKEDQKDGSFLAREDTPFVSAFVSNKETQNLWCEFFDNADKQHKLCPRKLKEKLLENYKSTDSRYFTILGKEQAQQLTEGAAVTINKSKPGMTFYNCLVRLAIFLGQANDEPTFYAGKRYSWVLDCFGEIVFTSDIVLAIFCEGWPTCAREWITRDRCWPDYQSVEKITQSGFHIVPKSSPEDGDFRLSFSCAEITLMKTLSPLQHEVMRAFKAVVTEYRQNIWSLDFKEALSSYYLKTVAFWYFEKIPQELWSQEAVVHHLVALLEKLAGAFRIQNLPMYFMPKVNLLKNVDEPEFALDLSEEITRLSRNLSAMTEAINNNTALKEVIPGDF